MIEEFEFGLETSTQCLDLPIQQDQQVNENIINNFLFIDENQSPINENQYGLGIFDFSNESLETIQIFNTQNVFNMVNETSYDQSLSTTINQDYLNDVLVSYEMETICYGDLKAFNVVFRPASSEDAIIPAIS
ncbi:4042_t:CDS:2, partial [Dentiscutata heterogama]